MTVVSLLWIVSFDQHKISSSFIFNYHLVYLIIGVNFSEITLLTASSKKDTQMAHCSTDDEFITYCYMEEHHV